MQEIGKFKKDINVILNNMEKYMTFLIGNLIFTDSFQFMNKSVSDLTDDLPKKQTVFIIQNRNLAPGT